MGQVEILESNGKLVFQSALVNMVVILRMNTISSVRKIDIFTQIDA